MGGIEYELDCLIFATGFEVGTAHTRRSGYDLTGRDGETLSERWAEGMRSMHGMHVHGFPNAFIIGFGQGGFTASFPHLLEECSKQIVHILAASTERGAQQVEVTAEAEAAWVREIVDNPPTFGGFGNTRDCTPGYYNNEGQQHPHAAQGGFYGAGALAFFQLLADWRSAGDLEGLELRLSS
ncbi:MAG: hypothetical protein ABIP36_07230 [Acidimicrobiales bacterium]